MSIHPTIILTTFVLIIFSTTKPTLATSHRHHSTSPSTSFIKSSCHVTQYPTQCYTYLSPFSNKIHQNPHRLALTALAVSLSQTRSASIFVARKIKSKNIKHRELEAVKDCIDTMGDSVDQLTRSFTELGHMGRVINDDFTWHMSNVQTWVSAALTDTSTCLDGFSAGKVMSGDIKGEISTKLNNVAQLTSNALALVNHFANARH